jgi:FtsP/CotA-like multicopper oxidase with cupredoxin domain
MIALLLLACATPTDTAPTGAATATTSTPTTPTTTPTAPTEPAALVSPAEAADLDPADDVLHVALTAAPHTHVLGDEPVDGYAYNGQVPGPTLRAKLGDTLVVDFTNALDTETTIHWHGVHVPWAMDGVTWMQEPILPGESFTYTFTFTQTGTFWYHPHFDTDKQVDLGLYGVIVVEDPADPPMDELVVVLDAAGEDADQVATDQVHEAQVLPTAWTLNGLPAGAAVELGAGPTRLRLLNASNMGYAALEGELRQIASDQGLLPAAVETDRVLLAPGDRAELELTGPGGVSVAPFSLAGGEAWGDPVELMVWSGGTAGPAALPYPGGEVSEDPGWTDIGYTFQGDGDVWMINGELFPDVTVESLALGADAIVEVRNISPSNHPFHLHGHSFEVLSVDGEAPGWRTVEDTIDVGIRSVVRLRLIADNPGDWMAHCHILPHAHQGMMTVLRVE